MAISVSVFISYARTDSAFVDPLEADLQARSFQTWVDRRKLEGGQNWIDELQRAIDRSHVLLVVLSPDAVESQYVRMEYRYAQSLKKPVIPLENRVCPKVPIDLNGLQWVNFKDRYEQGLTSLLATLSRITPQAIVPPTQSLKTSLSPAVTRELYRQSVCKARMTGAILNRRTTRKIGIYREVLSLPSKQNHLCSLLDDLLKRLRLLFAKHTAA